MIDLYQILGLPKKATKAQIRAAYRRLSKTAHPDVGGSHEAFERLKFAHDILTNGHRRDHYDRTGEASPISPDNRDAAALQILAQALAGAIGTAAKSGRKPEQTNLKNVLVALIQKDIGDGRENLKAIAEAAAVDSRLIKKFRKRDGESILAALLRSRIAGAEQATRSTEQRIATAERALKMIETETFDADPAEQTMQRFHTLGAFSQTRGF